MANTPAPTVWACLRYDDAKAAIKFLVDAFGFEPTLVVEGDDESERDVQHAELLWPNGGGIMLGSTSFTEGVHAQLPSGQGSTYAVTDDPDRLFVRATAAGAEVLKGLTDEEYGSRGFTVRDPEGNIWGFGTYRGAER
jgi:uncharacterized glyoxalase superfamily protein PhnB